MIHLHESWREEGGWVLILVGLVALAWGWLNMELQIGLPENEAASMVLVGLGLILACAGAAMHFARAHRSSRAADSQPARPRVEPMDPGNDV